MKRELPVRIIVTYPPSGVATQVQRGKDELLPPTKDSKTQLVFDFEITVDVGNGGLNFLGKYSQGPRDARFIYVNSGSYAGQHGHIWSRRAKISLMSITREQVLEVLENQDSILETAYNGTGPDGGPACASIKGIEWKIATR